MSLKENSDQEHFKNQNFSTPNVGSEEHGRKFLSGRMFGRFSFINISCGREEFDYARGSRRNMVEVAVAMNIVKKLYKAWNGSKHKLSVGLVSSYVSQVDSLKEKLGKTYDKHDGFTVKARSFDSFQRGEEEDVVILSAVRSNNDRSIDVISNDQMANPPLGRPRHSLWILGNEKALADSSLDWKSLIRDVKEQNCFFNAEEDEDLAKLLENVKRELDEFDDLLSPHSKLFENAKWKVIFCDGFLKSYDNLESPLIKKLVINLLGRLSCGWRPKRRNVDIDCGRHTQIFKQFKVKDLYVICSVDIRKELVYFQVLKVWDVLPLVEIPKLVKRLVDVFSMYNDDYLNCCRVKCLEGDLEVPRSWDTSINIVRFKNNSNVDPLDGKGNLEKSTVSESLSLMKFYSLSSGTARHLLSGCDGKELGLPFELTDEELEITNFGRSSFILGRSGTGKTTVLIMKLSQREQLYHLASEGFHEAGNLRIEDGESDEETEEATLRQLFVTVSPKLCYAVKQNVSRFQRFTCNVKSTEESSSVDMEEIDEGAQFRDIPDSFVNLPPASYPLIITFRKFVMMLDGTLGRSFFERFAEVRQLSQDENRSSKSVAFQTFIRVREVNYERFHSFYWPHFNQQLTKKLDSSVVFTEIISRIKGGVSATREFGRRLKLEEYMSMSKGRISSLTETEKEQVYTISLQYEQRKTEHGEFDLADLVIDLHRRFQEEKYDGDMVDIVYVDEVQDMNMRQIALFKYVCRNHEDGFVFSGDTAQTIARGVDFRFQDIRALFYNEFMVDNNVRREKGKIADILHLRQNFRTHTGVLRLSQSILDLLYHFFPSSIDVLSPETSLVHGEAPVLLKSINGKNKLESIFLTEESSGSRHMVGFGADQVILVRDEHVKAEILGYVGKHALVLTILECKGLEFQDVLLYNFFSSSPMENEWRVIYEYMEKQGLIELTSSSFPRLNDGKDIVLCSELKQLYVAITRTRQRLWILENVEDLTMPMFDYWNKLCLVRERTMDSSFIEEIRVESSKADWRSRGIKIFHQHNYDTARMCFKKAGDRYWEILAEASALQATANRTSGYMAHPYLRRAAELFESIGKDELAAQCYFESNDYETAGRIYIEKFGGTRLEEAGECFFRAKCYEPAARAYAEGHLFSKCLSACFNGKIFDPGMEYIQNWKQRSARDYDLGKRRYEIEKSSQDFLESAARHYNRLEDYTKMMKFVKAFDTKKSMRTLLMGLDRLDELLSLEQEWGCFEEAANIAKLKGELFLELDLLEKAGKFVDASKLIVSYVLCNSLWQPGSEGWPMKQFLGKEDVLMKSKVLAKMASDKFYQLVDTEVKVLLGEFDSLFATKQCLRDSQRLRSLPGEILCSRKILDLHFDLNISQINVEPLIDAWGLWKKEIVRLLEHLQEPEGEDDDYVEFCFSYFGLRKMENRLILMNPEAYWLGENGKHVKRKGLVTIDFNSFARAAKSYWSSELLFVATKVVGILEAINESSSTLFSSGNCKSKILAYGFEATQLVLSSEFLNPSSDQISMLQKFAYICVNRFFNHIFPMNGPNSMTKNVILFREFDLCRNLLEEVITRNIKQSELTYEKIGVVVTIMLGSQYLTGKVYGRIAASFTSFPHWREWIQTFRENKGWKDPECSVPSDSTDLPIELSLFRKFHVALEESYHGKWITKFMSPSCFLYLIERLLVMVAFYHFNGLFFSTRAPFVEWLISEKWNPRLSFEVEDDHEQLFHSAIDFLTLVVEQILCHEKDTRAWIRESSADTEDVYGNLVMRLIVMMCVICVNTKREKHSRLAYYLLNRDDIATKLPRKVHEILRRWKLDDMNVNVRILSDACGRIGNPLVMVSPRRDWSGFNLPGAIFIDLKEKPRKGLMLQKFFGN